MNAQLARTLPSLVLLALLSGCPTRFEAGPATQPDSSSGAADSITNITVPDDAGVAADAAGDAGDGGAPSAPDDPNEMPKLPPPLAAAGSTCAVNADCATGSCVDGICCSSAACGVCQSCAVAGALGKCSPIPALNEDPRNSCTGTQACDGKGHCAEFNGNACNGTGDCISGFCVDGVCCESACDQQCFACNIAFETRGMCRPLGGGTDLNASVVCAGDHSCAAGSTSDQPLCLLNDGQPCTSGSDCVSGQCNTFYYDGDGDKYGSTDHSISICGPVDAPPAGYVVAAGDCCDLDASAHPNQAAFFSRADACGSFDYNCDDIGEKANSAAPCSGFAAGASADCGKACLVSFHGSPLVLYTQACR